MCRANIIHAAAARTLMQLRQRCYSSKSRVAGQSEASLWVRDSQYRGTSKGSRPVKTPMATDRNIRTETYHSSRSTFSPQRTCSPMATRGRESGDRYDRIASWSGQPPVTASSVRSSAQSQWDSGDCCVSLLDVRPWNSTACSCLPHGPKSFVHKRGLLFPATSRHGSGGATEN